jgi:hypothetical protein
MKKFFLLLLGIGILSTSQFLQAEITLRPPEYISANSNPQMLSFLEGERRRACEYEFSKKYQNENFARLVMKAMTGIAPEATVAANSSNLLDSDQVSPQLVKLARSVLKYAQTSFDVSKEQWKAIWSKPPMFHYGMVLKPELEKQMEVGVKVSFEAQGELFELVKDAKNELLLTSNGKTVRLDASDLRHLLEQGVSSHGVEVFLDPKGNLVVEASGVNARYFASLTN